MTFEKGGALDDLGPRIEVHIGVPRKLRESARWREYFNVSPVQLTLLVDTGAAITSIREDAMRWLRLSSGHERSAVRTMTIAEPHPVDVWEIDLIFNDPHVFRNLRVFGCARMGTCDGLLGRDVLRYGVFKFDGIRKRWSLKVNPPVTILG